MQDIDQSELARLSEVRAHTEAYLKDVVVTAKLEGVVKTIAAGAGIVKVIGMYAPKAPVWAGS